MRTILDACCVINLHRGRTLDRVLALRNVEVCVGPRVIEECSDDCGDALRVAVGDGRITTFDDRDISAALYLSLLAEYGLGEGETECLAAAIVVPTLALASDDRRARTVATSVLGVDRVTGSLGLLRRCVAVATLTPLDAFRSYTMMVEAGAFLPTLAESFFSSD